MKSQITGKFFLLGGASILSVLAYPAAAQDTVSETVTVTGSRLTTTGFETPTPVTVSTAEALQQAAPTNLADALNQLPQFSGSTLAATGGGGNASAQANGQNLLSMRGLGGNRTLILFDGHRLPATNQNGSSDIDIIPQNLVSHVDVVTGGASAAYGSDAVAGVVNFALNTHFEGLKGDFHAGVSTFRDAPLADISAAYGTSFLDGRLRVVASGQYFLEGGIGILDNNDRFWFSYNSGQIPNPVAGAKPSTIRIVNIRSSIGSNGGLITAGGTLKGQQFGPGGTLVPFNFGGPTGTSFQSGGDGGDPRNGLSPDQRRGNLFLHSEYDAADWVTLYVDGLYSKQRSRIAASYVPEVGAGGQFIIFSGNPFIPSAVQTAMTAQKLASISVGRYLAEFPVDVIDFQNEVKRVLVGAKGDIIDNWHFDMFYSNGGSHQYGGQFNLPNLRNLYAAADVVTNPATGQAVCRSNYYNTAGAFVAAGTGMDPGCAPLNIFGPGTASTAAINYIIGNSVKWLNLQQQVAGINLNGDLGDFNLGAGAISVATGFEYRRETANQTVDAGSATRFDATGLRGVPTSLAGANRLGLYQFNNQQQLHGGYDIKEFYGEVGVPLIKDVPGLQSVDVNAAVRYTDYSQSGGVTTWKYGANWLVVDDLRLRATVSQDIRGPNLLELYNAQTQTNQNSVYPYSIGGKTTQTTIIASGNPNLAPEKALTVTYGGVLRPRWVEGLQLSADYFRIRITDAIGSLGFQNVIDQCYLGSALQCSKITVNADGTLIVRTPGLNLNVEQKAGWDFEGSYATPLFAGNLNLRAVVTNLLSSYTQAPGAITPNVSLATPGAPRWKGTVSATFAQDSWSLYLQERWLSAAILDTTKVEGVDVSLNHTPAVFYTDVTFRYRTPIGLLGERDQEFYLTINNLFNRQPPISGGNPTTYSVPVNFAYDLIGRYFTAGLKINMP